MLLFKLRLSTLITAVVALALLAVAIDWNAQPGVALAQDIAKPSEPIASSSAGVMTVTWGATEGVTSGYQYRYSTNSLCLLVGADCDFVSTDNEDGTDKDWTNHGSAQDATTLTFPGEGDPPNPPALDFDKTYFFQVRGKAGTETGEASDVSDGAYHRAVTKPAKLTGVTATAGNAQVTLSWDAPPSADNVFNYDYRIDPDPSGGSSGWTLWQNFTTSTNSHTVTGLTNGTTYSFQVRARNNIDPGPDSDTVHATPIGPPAAPRDLTAKAFDGEVKVYWANPNDARITKWQYRYSTTNDSGGDPVWEPDWSDIAGSDLKGSNNLRYEQADLTNGTLYTFQIRAVNDGGLGTESSTTMIPASGETAPSGMINVQWTESGNTARITWNQGDDSINRYEFRDSGTSSDFDESDAWGTVFTPASTSRVTTWTYNMGTSASRFVQIRPVNTDADPDAPGPITALTVTNTNTAGTSAEPPSAPADLAAAATPGQVDLSWTAPTETFTGFQTRQKEGDADFGDWSNFGTSTTTSHTISPLTDGTLYSFEVRAVNNSGTADDTTDDVLGAVASVGPVIPGAPNPPALSLTTSSTTNSANLSWTVGDVIPSAEVTKYQHRKRVTGEEWGDWADMTTYGGSCTATGTGCLVTGLSPGTTYDHQVRAVAGTIASVPSNTVAEKTASPTTVPAKPAGLRATGVANGVKLTWTDPYPTMTRSRSTGIGRRPP